MLSNVLSQLIYKLSKLLALTVPVILSTLVVGGGSTLLCSPHLPVALPPWYRLSRSLQEAEQSGMERNRMEWNGTERNEHNGVKRSGTEQNRVEGSGM